MSDLDVSQERGSKRKPQREMEWQAWVEKGRARELRSAAALVRMVELVSIAVLLITAALWSRLTPFEVAVRFIVSGAALVVMFQSFHAARYTFAALFGALAFLYNPLFPIFSFSGDWPRALVIASSVPFIASLAWVTRKVATQ
jgi:hypothetical protein